MVQSLQGHLIVASLALTDGPFARTVVLVIQHSDHGTFGVVLNRPAGKQLLKVWKNITGSRAVVSDRFSMGGPIGGPIFALHQSEALSEACVTEELFLSAETKVLTQLARQNTERYRVFAGMSGWQVGQLESELEQGKWYTVEADIEDVFGQTDFLWEKALRNYGRRAWTNVLKLQELPGHPELN